MIPRESTPVVLLCCLLFAATGCDRTTAALSRPEKTDSVSIISLAAQSPAELEKAFFEDFGHRNGESVHYMPPTFDGVDTQLQLYQSSFARHSPEPEIVQVDTVWPAILADSLIDLRPYLKPEIDAVSPALISNYTVNGRVVAIPLYMDLGVLFYRPSLLHRYGFEHPPETWDELEQMARRIQSGERRRGHTQFWGFVWQGDSEESLMCEALEWFLSHGGTNFIEADGSVRVNNPHNAAALRRVVRWIGTISPPGEVLYHETDATNLWNEGQAAFMRNWIQEPVDFSKRLSDDDAPFEVAALPSGGAGHFGTAGDFGIGISRYAAHPEFSIRAVREFLGASIQRKTVRATAVIPARLSLRAEPETMRFTPLRNAIALRAMDGIAVRPSTVSGRRYSEISGRITSVLNTVLRGKELPEAALAHLEPEIRTMLTHTSPDGSP